MVSVCMHEHTRLMGAEFAVIKISESSFEVLITRKLHNTSAIIVGISVHHIPSRAEVIFQILHTWSRH